MCVEYFLKGYKENWMLIKNEMSVLSSSLPEESADSGVPTDQYPQQRHSQQSKGRSRPSVPQLTDRCIDVRVTIQP